MDHRDILIVDDEVSLVVLMQRIITERTTYSVYATSSSLEAAKELEEHDYHLLIADLKMPDLDGMELLQLVKRLGKDIDVIIITAFGSGEAAIDAITSGAYDYLTKPFRKEQILVTIERAMSWRRIKTRVAELDRRIFAPPFEAASSAFRMEYARRALARCAGDVQLARRVTGLDQETLLRAYREQCDVTR